MARVLYVCQSLSEFIQIEIDILNEEHDTTILECPSRWPRAVLLWRSIQRADLVMSWFASWHSLIPAVLCRVIGRPFIVTVGGYDTANLPAIRYGHQRGGIKGLVARATMKLATRIIVVSRASYDETVALGNSDDRVCLVSHCLDPALYSPPRFPKENLAVMVAGVNRSNLSRKGLEVFVRAAAELPSTRFVLIGGWSDNAVAYLRSFAAENVRLLGRIPHKEKVDWLARAKVVVQPSLHEAFGLSVAEGMLCGAIPVTTRAGALPEVVGDCGVVVDSQEVGDVVSGIRRGLALGPEHSVLARDRVLEQFSIARKREALTTLIRDVLAPRHYQWPQLV